MPLDPFLPLARSQGRALADRLPTPVVPPGLAGLVAGTGGQLTLAVVGDEHAAAGDGLLARAVAEGWAGDTGRPVLWQVLAEPEATTVGLVDGLLPRLPRELDAVVLVVGAHDVLARHDRTTVHRQLARGLGMVRRVGTVVVTTPHDQGAAPAVRWPLSSSLGAQTRAVSQAIRQEAGAAGVACVALPQPSGWRDDGITPDEPSVLAWARVVAETLRRA